MLGVNRGDPVASGRLALRDINGNLCFTANEAWAWFTIPTQPWAFRSDSQREQLMYGFGDSLAWLAGHRLHLRVTNRPYPSNVWARNLHELTPSPLRSPGAENWGEHLVTMQRHLLNQTMAEKQVFLGVRLASRAPSHRLFAAVWRKPSNIEVARLLPKLEEATEIVGLPGLGGKPATSAELEWLLRRSVSLGLPDLSEDPDFHERQFEDIDSFEDRVEYAAVPLGRTVQITSRNCYDPVERHVAAGG